MHLTRRRLTIVATFAALFGSGLLLTAFGGTPAPPLVAERILLLGESGHIIRAHVGEVVELQLGSGGDSSAATSWRFTSSSPRVRLSPVFTAGMPQACPPENGGTGGREIAGRGNGATYASFTAEACPLPQPGQRNVRLLRLIMVAPGVATVKGWLTPRGAATQQSVPDFVFIILVKA